MSTRLVSFLGLGLLPAPPHYHPAYYELDGQCSCETPLLEKALSDLLPRIDSIIVMGTREVEQRWFDTGLFVEISGFSPHFVKLPHGKKPEERWEVFQTTVDALDHHPRKDVGETSGPDEIILDVTHAFRSQPLFGMAAVSYVLSEWARQEIVRPPSIRILYGAFEARNQETNVAPIWDLTEFVLSSRWNAALDALMRFGRADDLERLGEVEKRAHVARLRADGKKGSELGEANFPKALGEAAREFADDLALNRLKDILVGAKPGEVGSAARLLHLVNSDAARRFEQRLPLVRESMAQLRGWLEPLRAPNVLGLEGLRAIASLADLYGRLQRFAEQAALVREGLVTHHALVTGRLDVVEPGTRGCRDSRGRAEREWGRAGAHGRISGGRSLPPQIEENVRLSNGLVEPRNDIEHCGINDQPTPAPSLREILSSCTSAFIELIGKTTAADVGAGHPEERERPGERLPVFLNLSNHPVSGWSEEQVAAARDLGLGEPTDLDGDMPTVDPEADTPAVRALAEQIAERAVAQGAAGALVATEYTLTQALVTALQRRGVRCFAATTRREVVEEVRSGGAIEKKSVFRFVRWREFAREEGGEIR